MKIPLIKKSKKAGLPPGTLMYTGERKEVDIEINCYDYDEKMFSSTSINKKNIQKILKEQSNEINRWINVIGIHNENLIKEIGDIYNLHPLLLEDIMNPHQRPKLDEYKNCIFIVIKSIKWNKQKNEMDLEQISLILGKNFVISFLEDHNSSIDLILDRLTKDGSRVRSMGIDYLYYCLLDVITDNYFDIFEEFGDIIEDLESELINEPELESLQTIYEYKRIALMLRKSIWPLREVINKISRENFAFISENIRYYVRDLYDHTIQIIDALESMRDLLGGMLDLYLSSFANKQNDVMKVLTIFSTIFIPLTFIAGVYGMNFKYMPELDSPVGYPTVWVVMIIMTISMFFLFRKKKWL